MNIKEIEKYSRQAVRMLDNAIDLTKVPVIEGDLNSKETRVIGVGLLGVADYMARNKLDYIKNPEEVERVFECVSYNTLKSSIELAKEKGSFPLFEESCFKNGIFLGKTGDELSKESINQYDWTSILEDAKKGVRNAMLMAVAPNTSTSGLNTYVDQVKDNLQSQIDGAIQFWNGENIPALSNYPANEWTTEELRINHQADIYTVIKDVSGELKQGKSYRFDKVNGAWKWIELTDNELSAVQALASSKAKVFISTPTVPYNVGDLWLKNKTLWRCKVANYWLF